MAPVHLLTNPAASNGRAVRFIPEARHALQALGADVVVHGPTSAAAAGEICGRVAADGARLIVAGGDGMVHLAAQALAGTSAVLGIIPIGSGNDFARALDVPLGDVAAASALALTQPTALDVLRCNDIVAASVATVGFSARVNALGNRLRLGPLATQRYSAATALRLPRLAPTRYRVTFDDSPAEEIDATLIAVANTAWFGGGMHIAPDASPQDGHADVVIIGPMGRRRLLTTFRLVFDGRHIDEPEVTIRRASSVHLEVVEPTGDAALWADGEPCGPLPTTIRVEPSALHVAGRL